MSSSPAPAPAPAPASNRKLPDKPQPTPNKKLEALQARQAALERTVADLLTQRATLVHPAPSALPTSEHHPPGPCSDLTGEARTKRALDHANAVVKRHIKLLHDYNEIKDVAMGLMGITAEQRGVRIAHVLEDFGMDAKD
ncbi:hypothetical protein H2203_002551 [Taxawa tesnikishii (nom. ined.)]|nr:hypothetical protein H2203_002551 [Dothideales sp. JES 119]